MTSKLKPFPKYKDSGIQWIGAIPEGWEVRKLKQVTSIMISNVDKKSKPNEEEVLLCNYNEVYNNEFITSNLNFMKATASIEQINKFSIKKEDVIITKDSETPEDIAVPSLVEGNLNNIICGYHLALIRPNNSKIEGKFLLRIFQSRKINDQFVISANGVTRFGISTYPIKNSFVVVPPKQIQTAIANFLDKKTAKIDALIEKDKKLIELLKENRTALINHAVTKGLDPNVKLKDSVVDWIGEVPEGWSIRKLRHISDRISVGFVGTIEKYYTDEDEDIPLLKTGNVGFGKLRLDDLSYVTKEFHILNKKSQLKPGDIVIARHGESGRSSVIPNNLKESNCLNIVLLKTGKRMSGAYHTYLLNSQLVQEHLQAIQGGAVQGVINTEDIAYLRFHHPPLSEQLQIVDYLDKATSKIDKTIKLIEKKIKLLEEYKKSLIHQVVTGKVDVRGVEA